MNRRPYPIGISDDEWAFVPPYLTLMRYGASQRDYPSREVFNGLRWVIRAGASWCRIPHNLPPWRLVYDQAPRWMAACVFENLVHDLRKVPRIAQERPLQPSTAILYNGTRQSSPKSEGRAGYDCGLAAARQQALMALNTLGHLLARSVIASNEQDCAHMEQMAN